MNRRNFIGKIGVGAAVGSSISINKCIKEETYPCYIATWNNEYAVKKAFQSFQSSNDVLEGLVKGINEVENNPEDMSVGYGGRPDREGKVSLDACIMDQFHNAGSVCAIEGIKNPISVAKDVMLETPHVILAGEGAKMFALEQGYIEEDLLTENSKKQYSEWLKKSEYKPIINIENHDTVGMLGMDKNGDMVGGCSTSGLAYKMRGRVGDSPIIGAGLYCDNEVGSCVGTGLGEKVLTNMCAFLVVELMRGGKSPTNACKIALERVIAKEKERPNFQVALIAMNKSGDHGAYAIYNGFNYVIANKKGEKRITSESFFKYK